MAIDKSLAAMERENTELYRNVAQLQSQVETHRKIKVTWLHMENLQMSMLDNDSAGKALSRVVKENNELKDRIKKMMGERRELESRDARMAQRIAEMQRVGWRKLG